MSHIFKLLSSEDIIDFARDIVKETLKEMGYQTNPNIEWLTPEQVCEQLNITRSTLWRWDKEEYIIGERFGRRIRYRKSDIDALPEAKRRKEAGNE